MAIDLFPHQKEALGQIDSGCILCGGVGTGKSITSLAYFITKECGCVVGGDGSLSSPKRLVPLYIITTARKRDTSEWIEEYERFSPIKSGLIPVVIDSWNNLHKYEWVINSFFVFDEQRVVGSGSWVKSFLRITRKNRWILLSATPGDTWMDYIPVFVANGFYKNRTEFLRLHAVYNRFAKYPKVDRFVETGRLEAFRRKVTVNMEFSKKTVPHHINLSVEYDRELMNRVTVDRWDPYRNEPIQDISGACYLMRKIANTDPSRLEMTRSLLLSHRRVIVFYNYDHELELLRGLSDTSAVAEWNGHKHEPIPSSPDWAYLVQYMAGAEGWNCISTDTVVFYSQNYSYKLMTQAAGRIDRINTPYRDLYYYTLISSAPIDRAISSALRQKRSFNEEAFFNDKEFA